MAVSAASCLGGVWEGLLDVLDQSSVGHRELGELLGGSTEDQLVTFDDGDLVVDDSAAQRHGEHVVIELLLPQTQLTEEHLLAADDDLALLDGSAQLEGRVHRDQVRRDNCYSVHDGPIGSRCNYRRIISYLYI